MTAEVVERWAAARREYYAEIDLCGGVESPYQGYSSLRIARDRTFAAAEAAKGVLGHCPTDGDLS